MKLSDIKKLQPCSEALEWLSANEGLTPRQLWDSCPRGDWLLWLSDYNNKVSGQLLVKAAAKCAELSLRFVPQGEDRPRLAIVAALRWANNPSEKNRQLAARAAEAAWAVARAAWAVARVGATRAPAGTAWAVEGTAWAVEGATRAAAVAAWAAAGSTGAAGAAVGAAGAAEAAEAAEHKKCADIVRSIISFDLFVE